MKKLLSIVIPIVVPILLLITLSNVLLVVMALPRQSAAITPTLIWEYTSPLTQPVNYASAQVVKTGARQFIYLIGGERFQKSTRNVLFAEVYQDGTLSEWKSTTPLPIPGGYGITSLKTVAIGGQLYAIGGFVNNKDTNGVYCAIPSSDGNISSWFTLTNETLTPRVNHAVVNVGDKIYVIGGWATGVALNTVYSAEPQSGCGQIEWIEEKNSLIQPIANMPVVFAPLDEQKGMIYVIGGWSDSPSNSIYFAPVDLYSDGSSVMGAWQKSDSTLVDPLHFHSAFYLQDSLFILGGFDTQENSSTERIYRISIDSNGYLASSIELPPLPFSSFGHTSIIAGNQQAYIIGGERVNLNDYLGDVQQATLYTPFAWMSKSAFPAGEVFAGDEITYTINFTNNGLRPLTNLIITDEIPTNTILIRPEYEPDTNILTRVIPTLGLNETGSISFTVQVVPPLTAVPPALSTATPTPTIPSINSGLTCSTGWSGGGGTPRPTCTPTATPIPVETTPTPSATSTPATTRIFGLTPIPVINQAWMCEANWCIQSNPVFNAPYHFYLPIVVR